MISHLGCDPELFLKHQKTGEYISSVGLIGGSKSYPMDIGEGCAVQEDNVAVEFNTPPCSTVDDFIKSIKYNLTYLEGVAKEMELDLCIIPSASFSNEQLNSYGAQEFGCEPDYNAWLDGKMNPRPKADDKNLRSAGGHIHVESKLDPLTLVKAMDLYVGCMMLEFDHDTRRRELYGTAGAFRYKPYGVEYRTASNAWITSDERIRWVWAQTDKAINFVETGGGFSEEDGFLIQKCINSSDTGCLEQLKDKFYDL